MTKKTELHNLPQDITEHAIGEYLTEKDKSALALTSKTTQGLFQPHLTEKDKSALVLTSKTTQGLFQPHRLQNKLLLQVMHGEQDKAEKILKRHPELLEMEGEATDYSGRTFKTTAFRYALWALDTRYMCNMMLDCLPSSPQGEAIKQALLTQFKAHKQDGVFYKLNGETIHEKHYDFSPLIEALQTYVNHFNDWHANNFDAMRNQWYKVVGLAQRYVPAHVAQHYCDPDESFDPTPQFNKKTFKRALEFHNYNYITCKREFWFAPGSSTSVLGVNFGIFRGDVIAAWALDWPAPLQEARIDSAALTALCEARTRDLVPLMQRLEGPIQKPDADHDSPQCVIS